VSFEIANDSSSSGGRGSGHVSTANWSTISKVSDARLNGYHLIHESSGNARPVVYANRAEPPRRKENGAGTKATSTIALRTHVARAARLANEMLLSSQASEPIDLANAGHALISALDELWTSNEREADWRDLVNLLRTSLTKIEFEQLNPNQCSLICRFISECLDSGHVDEEDHKLGLRLLRKAGLDPWRVLSRPS
jgi:hypothetical protein